MTNEARAERPLELDELPAATPWKPVWLKTINIVGGQINPDFTEQVLYDGWNFFNDHCHDTILSYGIKFVAFSDNNQQPFGAGGTVY